MHKERASFTASMVAFGRGIGVPELPSDRWAKDLCSPGFSRLLRASEKNPLLRSACVRSSLGLVSHMALRMAMIDRAVVRAVEEGALQVVVLGAGFDSRALRLEALGSVPVFEVDHPNTQASKRRELERLPPQLTFVPVDFEVDSLPGQLSRAGHDAGLPTVWVWEGVTMYLSREAIDRTIDDVASLSAGGSTFLLTYINSGAIPFSDGVAALATHFFHFSGEHLRSWFSRGEMAAMLEARGFASTSDTNDKLWAEELGVPPRFSGAFRVEYLLEGYRP